MGSNTNNTANRLVFKFTCENCGKVFTKTKRYIQKNGGIMPKFCSRKCAYEHRHKANSISVKCENCGKEKVINYSEYEKSKTKHFFCSQSCAATYNNKMFPKRHKNENTNVVWVGYKKGYNNCPECGRLKHYKAELCYRCAGIKKRDETREKTLGDYIEGEKYLTTKCTQIRRDAKRSITESEEEKVCAICKNHEFDNILEVHHIKGILEFDKSAKIKEINDLDNLVWLCPNHHALVELGKIKISKKNGIVSAKHE